MRLVLSIIGVLVCSLGAELTAPESGERDTTIRIEHDSGEVVSAIFVEYDGKTGRVVLQQLPEKHPQRTIPQSNPANHRTDPLPGGYGVASGNWGRYSCA